jgi:hypothetical protein
MNVFFNYPLPQGYPVWIESPDCPPLKRIAPHVRMALHNKIHPDALERAHCQPLPHEDPAYQLSLLRQMWASIQEGDAERTFLLVLEYHEADAFGHLMFNLDFYPDVIFSPTPHPQGCA